MAEVYPRLKRYRKICKLVLRFHSSHGDGSCVRHRDKSSRDSGPWIFLARVSFRTRDWKVSVFAGLDRAALNESRSRFWGRRVWRSLNILAYNKKKREEASRVGGKVAYLIVRRKVHTRIQKVRWKRATTSLNARWILKIYLAKRRELLPSYFIPLK